jgi:hypothetical protein
VISLHCERWKKRACFGSRDARGSTTILVVADTSPLNYLIQIDCQELLTTLYQRVLVPGAVLGELMHVRTPAKVRAWLRSRPEWLEVREVAPSSDPALARLDPGEREAIQLAPCGSGMDGSRNQTIASGSTR